jgi:hypothetical protein
MTTEFVGIALSLVGAFHLLPAIAFGCVPARWPFKPFRRTEDPQGYWLGVSISAAALLFGVGLVIVGLIPTS